ncbi:MAG: copper amine oxidase N-terminal domain-containing protein [Peptococcaceae bacterium]|nr:copper amine oxidase N-terminal domain-containing protein [Peptococcaceae bacterium]
MKRKISTIVATALIAGMSTTAFAADLSVIVEGNPVEWTDAAPFINEDNRTMVPMQPIAKALDLDVTWNDDTDTAVFTDGTTTVELTVGKDTYHCFLNEAPEFEIYYEMTTSPEIENNRIYAPVRYLAEAFQYRVDWDENTQTVMLTERTDITPGITIEVEEEAVQLPEVPAGQIGAAFPMTVEAGVMTESVIAFQGVAFKDEPDFFEYSFEVTSDIDLTYEGMTYEFDAGYLIPEFAPAMSTAPGTYTVSWILPAEWFVDRTEDVVVSTSLTVTALTAETVLNNIVEDIQYAVYVEENAGEAEIVATLYENMAWLLEDIAFTCEIKDGRYNAEASEWTGTLTVTDTAAGKTASETLTIPVKF